jgi:hypothetical protein
MSLPDPTYPISFNTNIIGKPVLPGAVNYAKNWQPVDVTPEELIAHITLGQAYSAQFIGGYRKATKFVCAGFLAADVDRGLTLQDADDHAFVRHHAALIHTTASHTEQNHRFRSSFFSTNRSWWRATGPTRS